MRCAKVSYDVIFIRILTSFEYRYQIFIILGAGEN